jgi:hypothetical protein
VKTGLEDSLNRAKGGECRWMAARDGKATCHVPTSPLNSMTGYARGSLRLRTVFDFEHLTGVPEKASC